MPRKVDPRIFNTPDTVTTEVLSLAAYDAKYGRLRDDMRRDATTVTRVYRNGVLVNQSVQLSTRLQFSGLHNSTPAT